MLFYKLNFKISELPIGIYMVRVKVNGQLIPLYQYDNVNNADFFVS
jgi:hypothetical protein